MRKKGSRFGFCPVCKLYLHHAFLVVENTKSTQKVGLVCDSCGNLNISMTRDRNTLKMIGKSIRPGFHMADSKENRPGSGIERK